MEAAVVGDFTPDITAKEQDRQDIRRGGLT